MKKELLYFDYLALTDISVTSLKENFLTILSIYINFYNNSEMTNSRRTKTRYKPPTANNNFNKFICSFVLSGSGFRNHCKQH